MKKIITLFILGLMVSSLCACKSVENEDTHNHEHTHSVVTQSDAVSSEFSADNNTETKETQTHEHITVFEDTENTSAVVVTEATDSTQDVTVSYRDDDEGPLKDKHKEKIDVPFEQEHEQAQSISAKRAVCDKYAQEWQTVARRYYNELMQYKGSTPQTANYNTDEQLHAFLKEYDASWKEGFDNQCEPYLSKIIKDGENSEAGLVYSRFCYSSHREYALFLIDVYEELAEYNGQTL